MWAFEPVHSAFSVLKSEMDRAESEAAPRVPPPKGGFNCVPQTMSNSQHPRHL